MARTKGNLRTGEIIKLVDPKPSLFSINPGNPPFGYRNNQVFADSSVRGNLRTGEVMVKSIDPKPSLFRVMSFGLRTFGYVSDKEYIDSSVKGNLS